MVKMSQGSNNYIQKATRPQAHKEGCSCQFCLKFNEIGNNNLPNLALLITNTNFKVEQNSQINSVQSAPTIPQHQQGQQSNDTAKSQKQTLFKVIKSGSIDYVCLTQPNGKLRKILASKVNDYQAIRNQNYNLRITDLIGFTRKGKTNKWHNKCFQCGKKLTNSISKCNNRGKVCQKRHLRRTQTILYNVSNA